MSCKLCGSKNGVESFEYASGHSVLLCEVCRAQIESGELDENHFSCLNDAMWSEESDVKILSYILWSRLGRGDMCDMLYLESDEMDVAQSVLSQKSTPTVRDANGVELKAGDSVVILKDLDVKGAGFTAKRGTTVKNISIPNDVEGHIEGRVNGVKIYLKTEFLKKA